MDKLSNNTMLIYNNAAPTPEILDFMSSIAESMCYVDISETAIYELETIINANKCNTFVIEIFVMDHKSVEILLQMLFSIFYAKTNKPKRIFIQSYQSLFEHLSASCLSADVNEALETLFDELNIFELETVFNEKYIRRFNIFKQHIYTTDYLCYNLSDDFRRILSELES